MSALHLVRGIAMSLIVFFNKFLKGADWVHVHVYVTLHVSAGSRMLLQKVNIHILPTV